MATGTNNKGGRTVMVNVSGEEDDGAFVNLQIEDDETLDEVANIVFIEESDVDDFLSEVTAAVEKYKALKQG